MNSNEPLPDEFTKLTDLKPTTYESFNVHVLLIRKFVPVENRSGDTIYKFQAADETGWIFFNAWNNIGEELALMMNIQIFGCYLKCHRGVVTLSLRKVSRIRLVDEFKGIDFNCQINLSEKLLIEFDEKANGSRLRQPSPLTVSHASNLPSENWQQPSLRQNYQSNEHSWQHRFPHPSSSPLPNISSDKRSHRDDSESSFTHKRGGTRGRGRRGRGYSFH